MRILITSVGTSNSVNLIRYFKRLGDFVIGVDINNYGYTAGSIMVDRFYKVPWAVDKEYFETLLSIISKEKIDVLIPIHDIEVYICAKNYDKIKCDCIIPSVDVIEILRDKLLCSLAIKELGIPIPQIYEFDNEEIKRILRDRIGNGSNGIRIFDEGEHCNYLDKNKNFIQKYIDGKEYTVDVLADKEGEPIYIVPRERIEVKSGVSTKARVINDERLILLCKKILRRFKLPGFSNIQFLVDKDNNYWFVEINYRFSGCGAATLATSKDFLTNFKEIIAGSYSKATLNHDTKWGSIVTRYYEEVVYEGDIS